MESYWYVIYNGVVALNVYVFGKVKKSTDLVEEQDEIESEGNEQGQEAKVVEVTRKVVLVGNKQRCE